jgi:DNA-directed RNA polymerase subunit RPC12/RpoP
MIAAGTAEVRASVRLVGPNFLSSPIFESPIVIGVLIALAVFGIYRQLKRRGRWRCPACGGTKLDWEGSGTRDVGRIVEYRTYKCLRCRELLVEEAHGALQRLDGWVPGQPPAQFPSAKVR